MIHSSGAGEKEEALFFFFPGLRLLKGRKNDSSGTFRNEEFQVEMLYLE